MYFHNLAGEDGILLINHMISYKPSWMGTEAFKSVVQHENSRTCFSREESTGPDIHKKEEEHESNVTLMLNQMRRKILYIMMMN